MLNAAIRDIPLPRRMARLPVSEQGFPTPWFVARIGDKYDFRAIDPEKLVAACRRRLCWLCGYPLGQYLAFVIGPMCAVNRISSEPPSHLECAEYAVRACPFLSRPRMRRNETDLPDHQQMPGIPLEHNPGAALIWITKSYRVIRDHNGGPLFQIGEPRELQWYAEGRKATRVEILSAFDIGLPHLQKLAESEGREATEELAAMVARAMTLLPA